MSDAEKEISAVLEHAAKKIPADIRKKRAEIYGGNMRVLGLAVPEQRGLLKAGFRFTEPERAKKNEEAVLADWDAVLRAATSFEARSLALIYYENRIKKLRVDLHWPVMREWIDFCDNWEHSDRLSKIYARLLELEPAIYSTLKAWNGDKNPWKRRQSVVGLLCYANLRERVPPKNKIFPLIKNLLGDEDIYVQKGVGWTLREVGHVYSEDTRAFIEKHLSALSSTAYTAAVEKIPPALKDRWKAKRKRIRSGL